MDFYKELKLEPVRSEPDVWVSRIMILERITPDPVVIRDISLSRGLNIIWAEESESDHPVAAITGHSAGKTIFCRLIRYVLGEQTFGTRIVMELIRKNFPHGFIAAELHVRGRKWAVRRPFGSGRTYIKENASIDELLGQSGQIVTQDLYTQEIGLESLLDDLETGGIVQTGEPIQWDHILAWCTRDQEARFQNLHEWRSPRSEAETPSFRFPKAGPLFVMRTVLGLFLPDELKGEERLAKLQREKDRLTKEIEEKRREPQFRVNLYEQQLRQSLKLIWPNESDIDSRPFHSDELFLENLQQMSVRARKTIGDSIELGEQERLVLQTQIDELGAEIKRQEKTLVEWETIFSVNEAASRELGSNLTEHEEKLKRIEEHKDKLCPYGGVIVRECHYFKDRQKIFKISELQDSRALKQAEADRAEERRKIDVEKDNIRKEILRINGIRQKAVEMRNTVIARLREQQQLMRDIKYSHDELVIWMQRRDGLGEYEELNLLRGKLDATEKEITRFEKELSALLRQHDENRKRLAAIFSGAVRSVLSSKRYNGLVRLDNRELAFRITQGPTMSGEAVETLSVLLADVAALIYNTVSDKVHLPGFLLHDSPREADLGIGIYRRFVRFAASLQDHFERTEKCPFQYFITTTTAPPEELQSEKYVKLKLNASDPEGLLLRRNIAEVSMEKMLF
ncbi:MAG: hypothetical protein M1438_11220 [Deltaproteobacteria bacterium]|nr:hypothetical protein [Deltaproteobacteria bacterium]